MEIDYYTNVGRRGESLLIRGIKDGEEVRFKYEYSPTLYVEHPNDYGFYNIHGKTLKPIQFEDMNKANEFTKEHEGSNLKIYGFPHFPCQYILENFPNASEKYRKEDIRVFNIDIEVTSTEGFPDAENAAYPVTAICIHDSKIDKFVTFGNGHWDREDSVLPQDILDRVHYINCKDEYELLSKFLRYWTTFTPNIVTGWNIEGFDMPYLFNRLDNLGMDGRKLSPWRRGILRKIQTARGEDTAVNIDGIDQLDYMHMYKRNKIQDSYRLDNIASIELGERKLDYSEMGSLHKLYFDDFQKFIDYNIQDVNLVKRLDEKMGLINAQLMIAYMAGANAGEINSPVRTWDVLINREMAKERKIPHYHHNAPAHRETIPGGHVKEPQVGKHGWCVSFDLNSLYPHLVMQHNISPETINQSFKLWPHESQENRLDKLLNREKINLPSNHCLAASGYAFTNEFEGVIPRLMRKMYEDRKAYKKEMIKDQQEGRDSTYNNLKQYVMKILLNSGYGGLTNKFYRWFDQRLGESITLSGQMMIRTSEKAINDWMNNVLKTDNVDYIIAIDTDSNYVNMQPLVDKFFSDKSRDELIDIIDKICDEQITKAIEKGYEEASQYMQTNNKMVMEREAIASSAIWTAKKRYAMCVWDMERVKYRDEPKIKIQGLEAIRSSTPAQCREPLLEIITLALTSTEDVTQKFIADFRARFNDLPIEEIAFPRTMNNVTKMTQQEGFRKGTPPHIRGAITFNRFLKKYGIEKDWELCKNGEKGKFIWLIEPNTVGSDVISFNTSIPEEFNVRPYIDYNKQFTKAVIEPINGILEPIGWSAEKKLTLESFFG